MTSYEFEKAAKNAVIKVLREDTRNVPSGEFLWATDMLKSHTTETKTKCMLTFTRKLVTQRSRLRNLISRRN